MSVSREQADVAGAVPPPVVERPEPGPRDRGSGSRTIWIALLSGPSIFFGHFVGVYLLAEATCRLGDATPRLLGLPWVDTAILLATAAALGTIAFAAVRTRSALRRSAGEAGAELRIGLWLDALFAVAVLLTGLPALVLPTC